MVGYTELGGVEESRIHSAPRAKPKRVRQGALNKQKGTHFTQGEELGEISAWGTVHLVKNSQDSIQCSTG